VGDYNDANTFLGLFTSDDGNNRTGWKNAQYDALIQRGQPGAGFEGARKTFPAGGNHPGARRVPIIPLYFYVGINYYDTNKIQGIYPNILDNHPLQAIRRVKSKCRLAIKRHGK
jgi:oligopeptide transport system substrate-binding protein